MLTRRSAVPGRWLLPGSATSATTMVFRVLSSAAAVLGGHGGSSSSRVLASSTRGTGATSSRVFGSSAGCSRGGGPCSSAFVQAAAARVHSNNGCSRRAAAAARSISCSTKVCGAGASSSSGPSSSHQHRQSWVQQQRRPRGRRNGGALPSSWSGEEGQGYQEGPGTGGGGFWEEDVGSTAAGRGGGRMGEGISYDSARVGGEQQEEQEYSQQMGVLEEEDETEWMAGVDVDPEAENIFFGDKVPFGDLGLSPALCRHLESLELTHSTAVQAASVPGILSGQDIIVGAETGSGKTLAYLLPIVERLLRGEATAKDLPDELLGNARGWPMFPDVIVLVPNKELCEQVLSVLRGILRALEADGNTDVTAAAMYGSSYEYPYSPNRPAPSILVCTPSFLHKYTNMKAIPLFCKATTLVMDEADMLMEGSYKKQLDDILVAFRRADRTQVEQEQAGQAGGGVGMLRDIDKTQYVLAAATLPTYGLKSVDQYIKRAFPDARKIEQVHMHKHHPAIKQDFVEVGGQVFDKIQAVIELLRGSEVGNTRTMIFTNTAASCKRAFEALSEEGFSVVPYHKETVPLERLDNLQALRSGRAKILVCTDLAARGIDVPSVTHIVQMEMATNVVQHLHRLGRAARAGRKGKATNFYDDSTKDLVNSIKDAGEGSRLDGSFSRQRGFRKKFKKYGPSRTFQGETFVRERSPRGGGGRRGGKREGKGGGGRGGVCG